MRIYHAHPVTTYGTERERVEQEIIVKHFKGCTIVNPAYFAQMVDHGDTEFYLNLVDSCDVVVYSDIAGFLTAGVARKLKEHSRRVSLFIMSIGELVN